MSVLTFLGSNNPFNKGSHPKWKSEEPAPSFKGFAGPHGQAFTAFRWARNIAIGTTALSFILAGSTVYFAQKQAEVQTAVVVVDPYGRIEDVVAATGFRPDERIKGHLVLKYIEAARSISSDRVRLRSDLGLVERMTTAQGIAVLSQGYTADAWGVPSATPENRFRQVENIQVFPPKDGSETYNAMWTERLWEGGRLVEAVQMRGTVSLSNPDRHANRSIDEIKRNPTGLWVDSFKWESN